MAEAPDPKTTPAAIKRREELLGKFKNAVAAGDYDSELTDIWRIMRERQLDGVEWCWRLNLDALGSEFAGLDITEENWTSTEIAFCEKALAGDPLYDGTGRRIARDWSNINPNNSMTDRLAIIHAVLKERKGLTVEQSTALLRKVTGRALVKATSMYAVSAGPFEDGPPTP